MGTLRAKALRSRLRLGRRDQADPGPAVACRAPFTSLHVDQFGDVRPCCQSRRVLGNVATSSLEEIWSGSSLAELRDAMARDDLSLGCEHCEWAGRHGREATYATRFDQDRIPEAGAGPVRLELAPSNACNLQCAMCNGDWSSSIRLHREGRPALPRPFAERQLDEVRALAGGLDELHLFGGEPFLMPEGLALLEIAAEAGVRATITTNGSVLNPRVERLLDRPGINLVVSVDGASAEVYEAIRQGARWADLEAHLDRFQELARANGNDVDLAHCLMTANWFEFPEFLAWAHRRRLGVYVNDVLSPEELSLHHLPPPELRVVLERLRARDREVRALGGAWAACWERALTVLDLTLGDGADGARHGHLGNLDPLPVEDPAVGAPTIGPAPSTGSGLGAELRAQQAANSAAVVVGVDRHLVARSVEVEGDPGRFGVADPRLVIGRTTPQLRSLAAGDLGPEARRVLCWQADVTVEERRYERDGIVITERRTVSIDGTDGAMVRFDLRQAMLDHQQQRDAVRAVADDAMVVALTLDPDGTVLALGPADVAERLGLRTDVVGTRCPTHLDILRPELLDPPPRVDIDKVEPGIVAVHLTWPDGRVVGSLANSGRAGTSVHVFAPRGQVPTPR